MKILYLYAEVMGYTMATMKALIELGAELHVVHWDKNNRTPIKIPEMRELHKYPRSEQSMESLKILVKKISPHVTVVSGWQDPTYFKIARYLRQQNHLVVSGFDDQWHGSPRQFLAAGLGRVGFFYRYFSHAWVAGSYQYEYARRLGFKKKDIVFDLYSADLPLFDIAYQQRLANRNKPYPHRFLFVGRFEPIKGLETLFAAWRSLIAQRGDWELHLIGAGSLKDLLTREPGVVVKDFMQPAQLIPEILNAGCFVLPSKGEPWGVVVHEMSTAGLPLIVSDAVGASASFVISGFNGYIFRRSDSAHLARAMKRIMEHSNEDLELMGQASYQLSQRIRPMTSAGNLLSVIDQNNPP